MGIENFDNGMTPEENEEFFKENEEQTLAKPEMAEETETSSVPPAVEKTNEGRS